MTAKDARIKVLIADDHQLFRTGFARLLSGDPRFEIVGEAKNGADAIGQAAAFRPDVVLMDLQMPDINGAEAVKVLKASAPDVNVLIVSAYPDGPMLSMAIANGASGYLSKDVPLEDVTSRIIDATRLRRPRLRVRHGDLSDRELHVLKQVAAGFSNKQIAKRLGISEKTVRNHLTRVFNKLRATNRTEAVMTAIRAGMQLF